jgi:hypothetical protein
MSEPSFNPVQDLQEIGETRNFSGLALVGFLGSLLGCFSILYVHFVPIAIASIVAGSIVLVTAQRAQHSTFSQFLAAAAISIAATTASWGYFNRTLTLDYDIKAARETAELYLENLSSGNREKLLMLVGVPLESGDMAPGSEPKKAESPLVAASRKIDTDPAHLEIRARKAPAKWVYVGIDAEYNSEDSHAYKLRYIDMGQTNPPSYSIFTRKSCPKGGPRVAPHNKGVKYEEQNLDIHWYIDEVQAVQKQ